MESVQFWCNSARGLDIRKKKDTVRSFKEVVDSVYLDPWRAGNCPVCFG
jgi:hypothetical protein